jgi:putative acetyltransferase
VTLREETFRLEAAIRVLHRTVFGREDESNLVDALRHDGLITVSLVAEEQGQVIGHVLFSDIRIETQDGTMLATALAPVAVLEQWRSKGIASTLIQEGMEMCAKRGKAAALVLGDPRLYSRFGFSSRLAKNLRSPYSGAGAAWMAAELKPGALKDILGLVRYSPAFAKLGSE